MKTIKCFRWVLITFFFFHKHIILINTMLNPFNNTFNCKTTQSFNITDPITNFSNQLFGQFLYSIQTFNKTTRHLRNKQTKEQEI